MPPAHECSGDRHYSCASRFANEDERTRENAGAPTDADWKADRLIHGMAVCFVIPRLHAHFGAPAVKNTRTPTETPALDDAVLPEFVRPREAAGLLRMSEPSFKRYRAEGAGPVHYKFGNRTVYALADLAEWAAARRYRSTAETQWS